MIIGGEELIIMDEYRIQELIKLLGIISEVEQAKCDSMQEMGFSLLEQLEAVLESREEGE